MKKLKEQDCGQALSEVPVGQAKDKKLTNTTKLPCFLPSSNLTLPISGSH